MQFGVRTALAGVEGRRRDPDFSATALHPGHRRQGSGAGGGWLDRPRVLAQPGREQKRGIGEGKGIFGGRLTGWE
jgi:hypothetical protein